MLSSFSANTLIGSEAFFRALRSPSMLLTSISATWGCRHSKRSAKAGHECWLNVRQECDSWVADYSFGDPQFLS